MVVKCSDCKTLLRLDAKKITEGSNSSVRCPKCGAEGLLEMSTIEYDGKRRLAVGSCSRFCPHRPIMA